MIVFVESGRRESGERKKSSRSKGEVIQSRSEVRIDKVESVESRKRVEDRRTGVERVECVGRVGRVERVERVGRVERVVS